MKTQRIISLLIALLVCVSAYSQTYCSSYGGTTFNTGVSNVTFEDINNSDIDNQDYSYEDYTYLTASVTKGQSYDLTVRGNTDGAFTGHGFVWVDWNDDGDFLDTDEEIDLGTVYDVSDGIFSNCPYSLTIPAGATGINVRMRVAVKYDADPTSCEEAYDGEVEDYELILSAPDACTSYGSATFNTGVSNVTFDDINNSDTDNQDNTYEDYTATTATVTKGQSYDLTVRGNTDGTFTVHGFVWIDWNDDLDFDDAGETFDLGTVYDDANGVFSNCPYSVTVPAGATGTNVRMRVAVKYDADPTSCETGFDGEVEDYELILNDAGYCTSIYTDTFDDWITNVTFDSINNSSGQNGVSSYGDYTAVSTTVSRTSTYNLAVTFSSSTYTEYVSAYIDWNQDYDFDDANESYYLGSGADATIDLDITVPAGAALGSTRMRIIEQWGSQSTACDTHPTSYGETEDYTLMIVDMPMAFVSCNVSQINTDDVLANTTDNELIRIEVVTTGSTSPLNLTELQIKMINSTSASDVSNIHVYYTGTNSTFSASSEFNTATPSSGNIVISGSQALSSGTNYFWIAYDLAAGATVGNYIDAKCDQLTIDGGVGVQIPTVKSPVGVREIVSELNYIVEFDGVNDRVDITHNSTLMPTTALTVEAWIKADSWGSEVYMGSIINKEGNTPDEGYMFRVGDKNNDSDGGDLNFTISKGGTWFDCETVGYGMSTGVWYHVAGTFDGSKTRIYINGIQVDSLSVSGSITVNNTDPLRIGGVSLSGVASPDRYFDGQIEEARVWSVALTTSQIREMMYQEIEQSGSDVVGSSTGNTISGIDWDNDLSLYAKFKTASGTTVFDQSTNSNDGTIVNGATWNDSYAPVPYTTAASGNWDTNSNWVTGQNSPSNSWAIVKTKHDITLTGNESVERLLINDGKITTGSNTLTISSTTGAIERRSTNDNCFVEGNLKKTVATGAGVARTYELGTEGSGVRYYSPVTITFTNVSTSGTVTGKAVQTTQPNVYTADETMKRYWDLTNSGIAFDDYTADFTYYSTDFNTSFVEVSDEANMVAGKYDYVGESWTYPNIYSHDTGANTCQLDGLTSFSGFTFGKFSTSLPIELVSFKSECFKGNVELSWETSSERNNDYFILERSSYGNYFNEIARVYGNGTVNSSSFYKYFDDELSDNTSSLYRLSQVDYDGTTEVLKEISSSCVSYAKEDLGFKLIANHAQSIIHVHANLPEGTNYELLIVDATGKMIYNKKGIIQLNELQEDIIFSNRPNGMYAVSLRYKKDIVSGKIVW